MPELKSNHFVPKSHFKPFSLNKDGKAINLLHIQSSKLIENAPIKNQCAKDYFYGKDGTLERIFQDVEGAYSTIVKKVEEGNLNLSQDDLDELRDFSYFQYSRTEHAIRRTQIAFSDIDAMVYEGRPEQKQVPDESEEDLVRGAIRRFSQTRQIIADLKTCIILNKTEHNFVTSDDPAILANRFASNQPFGKNGAGLTSAGAMIFMPITPKHCIFAYDAGIYTLPDKIGCVVTTTKIDDITAINELQFLKAYKNIYFVDWEQRNAILSAFNIVNPDRPEKWFKLHYAVLDREDKNSRWFRAVHTKEERLAADRAIINIELKHPEPKHWCSKIKFRQTRRYIDTKSGAGLIRKSLKENPFT